MPTQPLHPEVQSWLAELSQARKREKSFREEAERIVALFEAQKREEYQFNILYSNTETLAPALYNSTPRPLVQRRFKDPDPLGALASKACQRTLEFLLDDGMATYATFDELMKSAVLEALVPGRGVTWFKYDAAFALQGEAPSTAEVAEEGAEGEEGEEPAPTPEPYETLESEAVCGEEVPWDRFLHGYAKKWKDVPWVARIHFMDTAELTQNFGAEIASRIELSSLKDSADGERKSDHTPGMDNVKVAEVFEVWDKASKKVYFLTESFQEGFLREVSDPLSLSGFFPCPKPLTLFQKISTLTPVPLYAMYEEQAKELNRVTVRINSLIRSLKIRGMYDASVEGIDLVLNADENTLIPAQNVAALYGSGGAGGLERSIWLFPIKDIPPILQQLYLQREQVKQVIYEITGIADIMRGSSQASETLGAQQLKNQWGTLRLKRAQKEVSRYARDCLRIMTEIAVNKLSPETLKGMTGLPVPTGAEKQQAQVVAMQAQALGQQIPPEVQQQLQSQPQSPSWDDLLGLLQNDLQRSYRIDIETNSTIDAEATEDKKDIGDLLNALGQFMSSMGPLIQSGTMPFDAAKSMMMAVVRRFKFGTEVEEQIGAMQAPKPPPDPAAQKAQVEMERMKLEMQGTQQQQAHDAQMQQLDMALKKAEHDLRMRELTLEAELSAAAHSMKLRELQAKTQATLITASAKAKQASQPRPAPSKD